jgi:glycosyltransferase involved in cell wall biosynthesis
MSIPKHVISNDDLTRADIYHSPFYPIPRQARAASRIKKFLTVYDLIPVLYPSFFEPADNRRFLEIIGSLEPESFALCISDSTKADLCNYRADLDPARVFVTHPAASELFYHCADASLQDAVRRKYNIPEGVPYLLSLSTFEPRKNINQVIKCFARLIKEQNIKDLRLVLVGTRGWDYDTIFGALSSFDISQDYIILTGYVEDEDLAVLYSGALAFVYLSLYEGFGLPPLEAMQCGTPVITSNTSSLPEVVGDAGIMIDPKDEDAICQSMLEVYKDSALRANMARKSIERARSFSWEKCTRETIDSYRRALGH